MAVDPNVYALSIQLQLESSDAFSTLEEFSQAAADVESRVSTAAQNSLNAITGLVENLNQQLSQAVATTGEFASMASKVEDNLSKSASTLRDAYTTEQDSLDDLQERLTNLEKIDDIQSDLEKSLENEQKTGQEYLALINRWIAALENKNLIHDQEAGMIEAEQDLVSQLGEEWESIEKTQISSRDVLLKISAALGTIWALVKNFDKETENFVTANYRVYGAQQQLVNNTRQLSAEYGIFREEAIATYKALADVKTPRDEIYKLSATVGRANRVTGLGIDQIAEYTRELRGAGFDAARTRKQIDMLSAAQRSFGLSTHDMQKAIEANNLSMEEQVAFFGKDAPEAFMKANLGLRAVAKELGVNQKAADDWVKTLQLTGVEAAIVWEGFAGIAADASIEDKFEAMGAASRNFVSELGITEAQMRGLQPLNEDQQVALSELTKEFGLTTDQLFMMARAQAELTDEQKAQMLTMAGLEKTFADQIEADKRWRESMNTLTAQLNQLKSAINAIIGFFVQLIADALIPVLKFFNFVIWAIGRVVFAIRTVINWMEKWIPGFSILMNVIRFVAGALLGLGLVLLLVGGGIAAFATAFSSASNIIRGSLNIIRTIGRAIVSIANAIGQSIRVIFTGLGQGLAALGNAVRPVIVPLMQLGVAALLVGAGFYLMGMGLAAAAEHGWAAFGMLVAMTVALIAIIVVFAIIATVAAPAIPLIVALAFAVLLLGAAAMLAGLGMYFMGMAVQQIALYGLAAAAALPALAGGVILLGIAGLFGFAGIMLLAVALWALAIPVMLLGVGFYMLAQALTMINADTILPIAWALLQASLVFLAAGVVLMPAAVLLAIGAVLISGAAAAIFAAGLLLVPGAWMMSVAAGLLQPAGEQLLAASQDLFESGSLILPAGLMMIGGAALLVAAMPILIAAGALMVPAGAALAAGSIAFRVGARFLGKAADAIYYNGTRVGRGGTQLLVGVQSILRASSMMYSAGKGLKKSVKALASGVKEIDEDDIELLDEFAWTLRMAGRDLLRGATYLNEGATLLVQAAQILSNGASIIQNAAQQLLPASIQLLYSGINIRTAGILLLIGSWMILDAVSSLWAAAFSLLMLAPLIINVGEQMIYGGRLMYYSGMYMVYAGQLWILAADYLTLGAQMLIDAANRIWAAGVMLQISAEQLYIGSFVLAIAAERLEFATYILWTAGRWLVPAALSIYVGMLWLESATGRFVRTIGRIDLMGKAMWTLAESFMMLKDAPIDSLGDAADSALDAIPNVNRVARELNKSADVFQQAADKFVKPVREIAGSLEELGAAMANIGGAGMMVQEDMDKLGAMLEKYTTLLEGTAQRIELAVVSKAQPAMAAAREEGLEDAVRSEAITQVQVMDKTEGEAEKVDEQTILLAAIAGSLAGINEKMEVVTGEGGGTELTTIVELLETYLPEITVKDEGLTTEFNQWMK